MNCCRKKRKAAKLDSEEKMNTDKDNTKAYISELENKCDDLQAKIENFRIVETENERLKETNKDLINSSEAVIERAKDTANKAEEEQRTMDTQKLQETIKGLNQKNEELQRTLKVNDLVLKVCQLVYDFQNKSYRVVHPKLYVANVNYLFEDTAGHCDDKLNVIYAKCDKTIREEAKKTYEELLVYVDMDEHDILSLFSRIKSVRNKYVHPYTRVEQFKTVREGLKENASQLPFTFEDACKIMELVETLNKFVPASTRQSGKSRGASLMYKSTAESRKSVSPADVGLQESQSGECLASSGLSLEYPHLQMFVSQELPPLYDKQKTAERLKQRRLLVEQQRIAAGAPVHHSVDEEDELSVELQQAAEGPVVDAGQPAPSPSSPPQTYQPPSTPSPVLRGTVPSKLPYAGGYAIQPGVQATQLQYSQPSGIIRSQTLTPSPSPPPQTYQPPSTPSSVLRGTVPPNLPYAGGHTIQPLVQATQLQYFQHQPSGIIRSQTLAHSPSPPPQTYQPPSTPSFVLRGTVPASYLPYASGHASQLYAQAQQAPRYIQPQPTLAPSQPYQPRLVRAPPPQGYNYRPT